MNTEIAFTRLVAADAAMVDSTASEPVSDAWAALLVESSAIIADRIALVAAGTLTPEVEVALKKRAGDLARAMRALGPPRAA